jgi:hypothetical protein
MPGGAYIHTELASHVKPKSYSARGCLCQCIETCLHLTRFQCLKKMLSGFQVLTPAPLLAKPLNYVPYLLFASVHT